MVDDVGSQLTKSGAAPRILLFSDDVTTRERVRLAVGARLERGAPKIEWVEVATPTAAIERASTEEFDLLVLDGEASPYGGMGVCRQLKDEVYRCPPALVLTGRAQDAWLASWSLADRIVGHPLDPVEVKRVISEMLTGSVAA